MYTSDVEVDDGADDVLLEDVVDVVEVVEDVGVVEFVEVVEVVEDVEDVEVDVVDDVDVVELVPEGRGAHVVPREVTFLKLSANEVPARRTPNLEPEI